MSDKNQLMKHFQRQSERQSEIWHEERLAEIRTQSHAMVWTGTPEELTAAITRWFESGRIVAYNLEHALRTAALHFVRPDGLPAVRLATGFEEPPTANTTTYENARQAFVYPLLEKKGWSVLDWANEAKVAHATAHDFLAGKTKPYRSTRKKLADVLGVPATNLPQ